jgi:hypothetical protein
MPRGAVRPAPDRADVSRAASEGKAKVFMRSVVAAALSGLVVAASPAGAEEACGQRGDIVAVLVERYQESPRGGGLQTATAMVEVWASDKTGTWTILLTQADGVACVVAAGRDWVDRDAVKLAEGAPS